MVVAGAEQDVECRVEAAALQLFQLDADLLIHEDRRIDHFTALLVQAGVLRMRSVWPQNLLPRLVACIS
jgi:hypothetical protein